MRKKECWIKGAANAGTDLLALAEGAGEWDPVDLSVASAMSTLSYTGGTTAQPKGVASRAAPTAMSRCRCSVISTCRWRRASSR